MISTILRKANAMSVIVTGVLLMIGAVIIGKTYASIDQTGLPGSASLTLNNTLGNAGTAFDFLGLGLRSYSFG